MPLLLLLLALASVVAAYALGATSIGLALLCLLLALGLLLAAAMSLLARRIAGRGRDTMLPLSADELRHLRGQATPETAAAASERQPSP